MAIGFGIDIAISPPVVSLEDDDMGYIVSFDSHGGSFIPAIGVVTGSAIGTLPTPPTRVGFSFTGWFTTPTTGGLEVTSSTVPTASMTAHARWASSETPVGEASISFDDAAINPAPEGSTKVVIASFFDSLGIALLPTHVTWSLFNAPGELIGTRRDIEITPATSVHIVLSGLDHVYTMVGELRRLVIEALYTSTDGVDLPLVAEIEYPVTDIAGR